MRTHRNRLGICRQLMVANVVLGWTIIAMTVGCGVGGGITAPVSKLTAEEAGYRDRLNDIYSQASQHARRLVEAVERSDAAAKEIERLANYSGKDRDEKQRQAKSKKQASDNDVGQVRNSLAQLGERSLKALEKVVPPSDMVSFHNGLIVLLETAREANSDKSVTDLSNACRQFETFRKDFDSTVAARPERRDVAAAVELTFTVPPVSVGSVSGLKPEFTIPVGPASVTVGQNQNYGAKRLVLRDTTGKERYFLLDRGFVYRQGPNDGFTVSFDARETMVLVLNSRQ